MNAPPIKDQLNPDKNKTNKPDNATIKPVPRSGCRATSINAIKIIAKAIIISLD